MCRLRFLAIIAVAVTASGCLVVTLQPVYDDQSVFFDEAMLGHWENAEDGVRATIEKGEWKSYRITYAERSTTRVFQGNVTRIGAGVFLDLTEMRGADPGPYLVPVHGIARIALKDDTLTVSMLDYEWFMQAMTRKTLGRLNAAVDDRRNAVMTAPTGELRRWLAQAPAQAFSAPATFSRTRD